MLIRTDIMKFHAVFASGNISRASNVGEVHIKRLPFLSWHQDHLQLSALRALTLGEIFRKIGTPH